MVNPGIGVLDNMLQPLHIRSLLIQPEGNATPMVLGGAPTSRRLFKFFLTPAFMAYITPHLAYQCQPTMTINAGYISRLNDNRNKAC